MTQIKERALDGTTTNPKGYEGQTFLVGDLVYLRGMELADGKYVTSWRDAPFPVSTERGEEIIKDDLSKEYQARKNTLAIVRKSDDAVVGSVVAQYWTVQVFLKVHIDPILADAAALKADAIATVVPWVVDENKRAVAVLEIGADEDVVIATAKRIGMRQTARFRDGTMRQGRRVDLLMFEYLNAEWVKKLGDPEDEPLERTGTGQPRPVPPKVVLTGDPPPHAVMVGQRVYLRPYQKADADAIARYSVRETEAFWDNGRFPRSAVMMNHFMEEQDKAAIPVDYSFAVCLRENDEYIGHVELLDLDLVNRVAETGSEINRPEYRGGGYGSEAKQLLLEYAFDRLGLHMVRSVVIFPNTRSAAALRKQGYKEAGYFYWGFPDGGGFGNFVVFDLLADEWRAMPRAD